MVNKTSKNTSKGASTDRMHNTRYPMNDIQRNKLDRIKRHYGFTTDIEAFDALLNRAALHIDTGV